MLIGGLDVGTTGCKLTVYNENGRLVCDAYREYDTIRECGRHEIDANTIFGAVCDVITEVCAIHSPDVIGVTTFGETFVALDANGETLLPSMLYTDPRGEDERQSLLRTPGGERITAITGVKPNAMYSMCKIMWIKNNCPDVYKRIKKILLMQDFIIYKLTGVACIDYSLAARTMAFDIREKCWSGEILNAAGIDKELLSRPVPAGNIAGELTADMAARLGAHTRIKIVNGCHDQVSAAVGAGVFEPGHAIDGIGTVECVTPVFDKIPENRALYDEGYSVVPYVFDGAYVCYALSFAGGSVLKWYRDNFARYEKEIAKTSGENVFAMLDKAVSDTPTGILVMPHFAGAANPYMDSGTRAAIIGLSFEHTGLDIYKALMEGVTYEIMLNIEHLESFGIVPKTLCATGGGATSEVWLQIKADILNRPVTSVDAKEVGTLGACMLAGCAAGIFKDLYQARDVFVRTKKTFLPNAENAAKYKALYGAYRKIYSAIRPIIKEAGNE